MYRIRRFGVVRTATVVAVAYAIAFAFIFVPIALLGLMFAAPRGAGAAGALGGMAFLAVVLLVFYPLLIWVVTAIACLIYNLAARWVGGIEVEIDRPRNQWAPGSGSWGHPSGRAPAPPTQPWPPYSPGPGTQPGAEPWETPPRDAR